MKSKLILAVALSVLGMNSYADDWGCQVLLCLANPNGPKAVSECVPPINKLWKELAKGKPFPTCMFSNDSGEQVQSKENYGSHQWASGEFCPSQYIAYRGDNGIPYCIQSGAVSVVVNGAPFTRIWWNGSSSVTEYNMGGESIDTAQYQQDYAAWKAKQAVEQAAMSNN